MTFRVLISLFLVGFGFSATASFPSRVTVQLKNKMSCRDVRKLLKPSHLYVNCQLNSMRSNEYSAEYLGQQPLMQVVSELASNAKVQGVATGEELTDQTPDKAFRPVQGSLY